MKCVLCGVDPDVEIAIMQAGDTLEEARLTRKSEEMEQAQVERGYDGVYDEVPNRFTWQDASVILFLMDDPERLKEDLKAFIHNSTRDD